MDAEPSALSHQTVKQHRRFPIYVVFTAEELLELIHNQDQAR